MNMITVRGIIGRCYHRSLRDSQNHHTLRCRLRSYGPGSRRHWQKRRSECGRAGAMLSLNLEANFAMWRILVLMAVLVVVSLPSYAQRGPAFPSESNRGPAFPKSVSPTDKNQTNWATSPQDYTPSDTYQQLWIIERRWDQLYGSPGWRGWRRGQ
jgi:hypothetical protein